MRAMLLLLVLLGLARAELPSKITLKAAVIPNPTFLDFQLDLVQSLERFALLDNVTLTFQTTEVQKVYDENLALIAPDCHPGETREILNVTYGCDDFDMILGPIWTNPSRYAIIDFTPPWLQTSISAIKKVEKTKNPLPDVTTLKQATAAGAGVCVNMHSFLRKIVSKKFPDLNQVPCDRQEGCLAMLQDEECALWVSDEMILRRLQAEDPTFEMTGERFNKQLMAWPVRKSLNSTISSLLNRWIYAAVSNQTIDELYFEYFEKKLCPIGTAGKNCELSCDPNHGMSNAQGKCVCESMKWTGEDCSMEAPEELNLIPMPLKVMAYTMFAFNVAVIVVCGVWMYAHWKSRPVQASQPSFLLLVLLGCLISSCTILALAHECAGDGPVPACMAIPWLYSVGFSVTFGTLWAKIRRVYNIYTQGIATSHAYGQTRSNTIRDSAWDTLFCIGKVLLLDLVILILWTILDPLEWHRFVTQEDQFGIPLESQGFCISDNWEIFAGFIAALHLGLLIIACYMSYVARHIPTKFQEGKYVAIAIVSHIQIFVIGIPVLVLVGGDPATSFFVRCIIIWMNDLVVVTLIFGNLMRSVHLSGTKEDNTAQPGKSPSEDSTPVRSKEDFLPRTNATPPELTNQPNGAISRHPTPHPSVSTTSYSYTLSNTSLNDSTADVMPQHGASIKPMIVSNLSVSSRKSVTFSELVVVSEYEEKEEAKRFSPDLIQGAPLKPERPSTKDGMMTKPMRKESIYDIEEEFSSESNHSDRFSAERMQGAPFKPKRPSAQDGVILQPLRKESVFEVETELLVESNHSDRFSAEPMQGAPFKPRRPATQDGVIFRPIRKESVFEEVEDGSSSKSKWMAQPVHGQPHKCSGLTQPVRIPSDCSLSDAEERGCCDAMQPTQGPNVTFPGADARAANSDNARDGPRSSGDPLMRQASHGEWVSKSPQMAVPASAGTVGKEEDGTNGSSRSMFVFPPPEMSRAPSTNLAA